MPEFVGSVADRRGTTMGLPQEGQSMDKPA
jgi:hypothetical protein